MWQKERSLFKTGSFYPQMKAESQCYQEDNISNTLVVGTNPGFQNGIVTRRGGHSEGCSSNRKLPERQQGEILKGQRSTSPKWQNGNRGGNTPMVMEDDMDNQYVVRRLTPMECERLQGYPDNWTNIGEWTDSKGKKHKDADSPRYKALGNSIALPFWQYLADKMCNQLRSDGVEEPTMASLFDGISGFCLVYARAGVTPVWVSEIEEFPIAVAKKHFGDDDTELEGDYEQYL